MLDEDRVWMTADEVMAVTGLSRKAVLDRCKNGVYPGARKDLRQGRSWRIPEVDVMDPVDWKTIRWGETNTPLSRWSGTYEPEAVERDDTPAIEHVIGGGGYAFHASEIDGMFGRVVAKIPGWLYPADLPDLRRDPFNWTPEELESALELAHQALLPTTPDEEVAARAILAYYKQEESELI